jgi:hypothetical protein
MDLPINGRATPPQPSMIEVQKPPASHAVRTLIPAPLSVDEARIAAETAFEPREKTAIIRALLSEPPAAIAALNLATQIAKQADQATFGYATARDNMGQA